MSNVLSARQSIGGLLTVATAALALPGAAMAQSTIEKSQASSKTGLAQPAATAWTVDCADEGSGLACKAKQAVVLANTQQLVLLVSVSKPAKDSKAPMLVQLPHGLFIPAGVTLGVDEATPEKLEIQTCDARGCYAGLGLAPDKIAAISKGTKLSVAFEDLKKQKIVVPVSLAGFYAAFRKL